MSKLHRLLAWTAALCCSAWIIGAHADDGLLTGLESSHVKISTGFTGQHIFVFGSTSLPGDMIIRVTSPDEPAALSRKDRVGPFWLKGGKLYVDHVPGLIYLLSNRPLHEIADRSVLEGHGLTFHSALSGAQLSGAVPEAQHWQAAFERLKQDQGLYRKLENDVRIHNGRLYSANFPLPATLPLGTYHIDVYAFHKGKLLAHRSSTLLVNEVGIERWISQIALRYSGMFGVLFTLLAIALGLALSVLLRRNHARRP